ncbi:hypothetical protein M0R45_035362 [Rubus argutus]|uniref:Reverse transcriptase domain-containing protein n=1 Tax=Rubus argutus TaxID=59490 RepID=A0AAW1VX37_RUBAR
MCSDCSLLDVPTSGLSYTWTNRRTFVRLDRALGNLTWFESWQSLKCRTLTMSSSDHCPILVTCDKMVGISKPPFRFQGMWLLHPNFISLLHDFWDNHQVVGCPMFVLATKLRALKSMLKEWNFNVFGDINQQVNLSKLELDLVQNEISSMGPSALRFHREDLAHSKFQSALSMQDTFLRTKARVRWLVDGDRNTSFLHNMIKIRRLHQSLSSLRLGSVVITDSQQIINHTVTHFKSAFTMDPNILNTGLVERVIPNLVTLEENIGLTSMPLAEEIYTTLMTMDGSSAPGPDGFGGCFFQNCWNVVAQEVISAVQSFFDSGFILPHFNSNLLILIPKKDEADNISDYRPIALANFVFKLITKIIADRLGKVAARIISPNQSAFLKGRSIVDPIILTSECINLLDRNCKNGNIAIKLDISKAFDSLDWNFLLRILDSFGFDPTFINWIQNILHSAYLSISINGTSCGYFSCSRGVRQGDPLSPILFCLAEEVLSRGLTNLVSQGKLTPMASPRSATPPSHVLFADDVMVFMQGSTRGIKYLMKFLKEYASNSGQVINRVKSSVYLGRHARSRETVIQHLLGIREGVLPFTYLGVPIFKGRPKSNFFRAIADKVRCKLSSWNGHQLSKAARMQLISSVIQSLLIYSFQVYAWPNSLLIKVQRWTRNFFWTGDPLKKGATLIAWSHCCLPKEQGGLGLKNLFQLNKALLLKRCWDMMQSSSPSAIFLRNRFLGTNLTPLLYYQRSSVWLGLKNLWSSILSNIRWLVATGDKVSLWNDNWLGIKLSSLYDIPLDVLPYLTDRVDKFIIDNQWVLPPSFSSSFPEASAMILNLALPCEQGSDQPIWPHVASGHLTSKEAYNFLAPSYPTLEWGKLIWHPSIQPRKSIVAWMVLHGRALVDSLLQKRGVHLCSQCLFCLDHCESLTHLFFECNVIHDLWVWLLNLFNLNMPLNVDLQIFFSQVFTTHLSSALKQLG